MEGVGVKFYRQQGSTAVLWGFSHVGVSTEYSKDTLAFGGSQFIIWRVRNGEEGG